METLKTLGGFLLWLVIVAACLILAGLFFLGAEWASVHLLPWFIHASVIATAALFFVLLPLSAVKKARGFTSSAILLVSYIFGITVWMDGLLITLTVWGIVPVIFGLCFMGVGVVPIGLLAALLHGMWSPLTDLLVLTALTFGSRIFSFWLGERHDAYEAYEA